MWTTKSSEKNFGDLGNNTKYLTLLGKAVTNYSYNRRESFYSIANSKVFV